ncbi:hypothetical protein K438DRAFT_2029004 [Mycena galopus ATCC 62051]|nr:hypothetical protein K438DRAFT_2029004 [Mycena galopus ATCC 62051]
MALSYSPIPSPSMSALSASLTVLRLLVPMPVLRTPNAPYFDKRGVRAFLALILQHGSCAGITDADELVSFIVRYSSDRVRAVIQYIPELDEDTPNRTWSAAEQQMLLLYGSSDEGRRVSEQELLEFCREHSAKPPFRSKLEVEQYLRSFQLIAAPLLKQQDITIKKRDYYFVSGIPSVIKNWFIVRVPEHQRARSNLIPLADTLGILYGYFDPETLFPDLWNELTDCSDPVDLISPSLTLSTPASAPPATSIPVHHSIQQPALPALSIFPSPVPPVQPPRFDATPVRSPSPSSLDSDEATTPQFQEVYSDSEDDAIVREEFSVDKEIKVSPSEHTGKSAGKRVHFSSTVESRVIDPRLEESTVYFCGKNKITDRVSELRNLMLDVTALQVTARKQAELSDSPESTLSIDETLRNLADIYRYIEDELERSLVSSSSEDTAWASDDSDAPISTYLLLRDHPDAGSLSLVNTILTPLTSPVSENDDDQGWTPVTRKTSHSHRERSGSNQSIHTLNSASDPNASDSDSTIDRATHDMSREDLETLARRHEA